MNEFTLDPKEVTGRALDGLQERVEVELREEPEALAPARGMVAICSRDIPGIITSDEPRKVTYPDGNEGVAYVGVRLTDGGPWSSRTPRVLGRALDLLRAPLTFAQWARGARFRHLVVRPDGTLETS
jgi:hypothetical protein